MKKRSLKRSLSMALVLAITASMASPAVIQAADTMPWTGDKAIGDNQAHVVG